MANLLRWLWIASSILLLQITICNGSISWDFDDGGFGNFTTNINHPWLVLSGSTPSSGTGPKNDHTTGDSSGYYAYVESSYPNSPLVGPFNLETSVTDNGGVGSVEFWYSMRGGGTGDLSLLTSQDHGASWSLNWQKTGSQGDDWLSATVSIESSLVNKVRFSVTTGADFTSDIAIDDIYISDLTTSSPTVSPPPTSMPSVSSSPTLSLPPTSTYSPIHLPTLQPSLAFNFSSSNTASNRYQLLNQLERGHVTVRLTDDIALTSPIELLNVSKISINGNGYEVYGYQNNDGCFLFQWLHDVEISNTTFRNCTRSDKYGGALYVVKSTFIVIKNCKFLHNNAVEGGAVYYSDSISYLHHCQFIHNVATDPGGAIRGYVSQLWLYSCVFKHNAASNGGAISVVSTTVNLKELHKISLYNCNITSNEAAFGGGLYASSAVHLNLTNVLIINNTAQQGGGVYVGDYASLYISSLPELLTSERGMSLETSLKNVLLSQIVSNYATELGGGMNIVSGASASIVNTLICYNRAEQTGGGVKLSSSSYLNISHSEISFNTALSLGGGGVYLSGSLSYINIFNSVVRFNKAVDFYGGGIYQASGKLTIISSRVKSNQAISPTFTTTSGSCDSKGGCFQSSNYPSVYDDDETCLIASSAFGYLDVISFDTEDGDVLNIDGVQYYGSNGPSSVIPIQTNSNISFVSDKSAVSSGFSICYATASKGGGIYMSGGDAKFVNVTLSGNSATQYGGGVYINGGNLVALSTSFDFNQAYFCGHAFYLQSGSFNAIGLSLISVSSMSNDDSDSGIADIDGISADAAECLSPCLTGERGNCSYDATGSASECFFNCECSLCPAGRYFPDSGATTDVCLPCGAGQISIAGSSSCSSCQKGKYASNSSLEHGGGLTNQIVSGATSCNDCPAGYFSASKSSLICQTCPAGKFSKKGASVCIDCSIGFYSLAGSSECTACSAGYFSAAQASSVCTACDTGKYTSKNASSSCLSCPTGKYQGVPGQPSCINCETGKYAATSEASACVPCEVEYISDEAAPTCDLATNGYYLHAVEATSTSAGYDFVSMRCPSHATCYGRDYMPIPEDGYWVDRSSLFHNGKVFRCLKLGVCKIENLNILHEKILTTGEGDVPNNSGGGNLSCWSLYAYNSSKVAKILSGYGEEQGQETYDCSSNSLQCRTGSIGVLCGSCEVGYSLKRGKGCEKCSKSWVLSYVITGLVVGLIALILLFRYRLIQLPSWCCCKMQTMIYYADVLYNLDQGKLRVLWSSYQIIHSIEWNLEVQFPDLWRQVNSSIGFISFNVFPLSCIFGENRLLPFISISLIPICISLMIMVSWLFNYWWLKYEQQQQFDCNKDSVASSQNNNSSISSSTGQFSQQRRVLSNASMSTAATTAANIMMQKRREASVISQSRTGNFDNRGEDDESMALSANQLSAIRKLKNDNTYYLLLLGYLVLPVVTHSQLQALDCVSVSDSTYVRTDTSIQCDNKKYYEFRILNIVFLFFYLIIPLIWFAMLYKEKSLLKPTSVQDSETKYFRANEPKLAPLRFLFDPYKSRYYYFEIVEMYRRIFFVGVIPLLSEQMNRRAAIGMLTSFCCLIFYRELLPYYSSSTNSLANLAQVAIFMTFGSALAIETDLAQNLNDFAFGLILCAINLSVLLLALVVSLLVVQHERKEQKKKTEMRAGHIEHAVGFTDNKFASTFDSIFKNFVPSSHCLVCWYGSYADAKQALRCGIPLVSSLNKIPLQGRDEDHDFGGGVVLSLHGPHELDETDKILFPNRSVVLVCSALKSSLMEIKNLSKHLPPSRQPSSSSSISGEGDEKVHFNNSGHDPGSKGKEEEEEEEDGNGIRMISMSLLKGLRSEYYQDVIDKDPWKRGGLFLPPHRIMRAYQLVEEQTSSSEVTSTAAKGRASNRSSNGNNTATTMDSSTSSSSSSSSISESQDILATPTTPFENGIFKNVLYIIDNPRWQSPIICEPSSTSEYCHIMAQFREISDRSEWSLLYHYTQPLYASLILKSGFRMSTQGQGDGGVYFSTRSPASYGLGTSEYEDNIIIDCYGKERISEFKGRGYLDLCIIYGAEPSLLTQAPGGRNNAVMVDKPTFEAYSLPNEIMGAKKYFLRPDRILGLLLINNAKMMENDAAAGAATNTIETKQYQSGNDPSLHEMPIITSDAGNNDKSHPSFASDMDVTISLLENEVNHDIMSKGKISTYLKRRKRREEAIDKLLNKASLKKHHQALVATRHQHAASTDSMTYQLSMVGRMSSSIFKHSTLFSLDQDEENVLSTTSTATASGGVKVEEKKNRESRVMSSSRLSQRVSSLFSSPTNQKSVSSTQNSSSSSSSSSSLGQATTGLELNSFNSVNPLRLSQQEREHPKKTPLLM